MGQKNKRDVLCSSIYSLFFSPHGSCTSADRSSFVFDGQVGQDAGPECHEGHPHLVPHVVCIHVGVDVHVLVTCAGKLRPRDRDRGFTVVRIASAGEGGKKGSGQRSNSRLSKARSYVPVWSELYPVLAKLVQ